LYEFEALSFTLRYENKLRIFGNRMAISLGAKRPGREADHSPSAEVKNAWSYTSTSLIRLHGVVLKAQGQLYLCLLRTGCWVEYLDLKGREEVETGWRRLHNEELRKL
jgi:hypothetical protein